MNTTKKDIPFDGLPEVTITSHLEPNPSGKVEKRIGEFKQAYERILQGSCRVHFGPTTNEICMIDATPMDEFYKKNGGAK